MVIGKVLDLSGFKTPPVVLYFPDFLLGVSLKFFVGCFLVPGAQIILPGAEGFPFCI